MPGYQVDRLTKTYRGPGGARRAALDGVSFDLAPGELLVVLGPAGAGKSTLLRVLAGLERPEAGRILEHGGGSGGPVDLADRPPHRRDVAMVFQDFSLYPRMRVGENLAFPLRAKALALPETEITARVREAAAMLGLSDKLDRWPTELSGGEMQRVALGRALVRRPRLFLLDEPLANLDAKLRERMVVEIRRIQRARKAAMIYVTHDHAEAMSLADRILVLHGGKALQTGSPDEIYRHPADSRVARLLGRSAINLFAHAEAARLGLVDPTAPAGTPGGLPANAADRGIVGVRPEAWRVIPDGAGPAIIKGVELVGPRLAVFLDVGGVPLRALAPASQRFQPGDRVRLGVDPADIHHFQR
jgi:ABC-type sugar transport system ATPase subunit